MLNVFLYLFIYQFTTVQFPFCLTLFIQYGIWVTLPGARRQYIPPSAPPPSSNYCLPVWGAGRLCLGYLVFPRVPLHVIGPLFFFFFARLPPKKHVKVLKDLGRGLVQWNRDQNEGSGPTCKGVTCTTLPLTTPTTADRPVTPNTPASTSSSFDPKVLQCNSDICRHVQGKEPSVSEKRINDRNSTPHKYSY